MSKRRVSRGLYPVTLLFANAGLGTWLYAVGAVVAAVALWVAGALVVSGALAEVSPASRWSSRETP